MTYNHEVAAPNRMLALRRDPRAGTGRKALPMKPPQDRARTHAHRPPTSPPPRHTYTLECTHACLPVRAPPLTFISSLGGPAKVGRTSRSRCWAGRGPDPPDSMPGCTWRWAGRPGAGCSGTGTVGWGEKTRPSPICSRTGTG